MWGEDAAARPPVFAAPFRLPACFAVRRIFGYNSCIKAGGAAFY